LLDVLGYATANPTYSAKNIDSNNIKIFSDSQNRFVDNFERTLRYINGEGLVHQEVAN
jgi:hypothetical protein